MYDKTHLPDNLSVQGMLPFLAHYTYSKSISINNSLESTNKTAKEMATANSEHGTVIIADQQTAGQGRYGRRFFSPPGCGLYMSFILHPEKLRFETPTAVTAMAAVAVCEAIEAITPKKPSIKWVNDIFLEGQKICGILTEAVTDFESGRIPWLVLGIGINVCTRREDFPDDLRPWATSLDPDGRLGVNRNRLAAEIINRILDKGSALPEEEIFTQYKKRLLWLGEKISVTQGGRTYDATTVGLDSSGRLLVERDDGETVALANGEIRIRQST